MTALTARDIVDWLVDYQERTGWLVPYMKGVIAYFHEVGLNPSVVTLDALEAVAATYSDSGRFYVLMPLLQSIGERPDLYGNWIEIVREYLATAAQRRGLT